MYSKKHMNKLHNAVKNGNLERCKQLIENGFDIDAKDHNKDTPLHWAVILGHLEIVSYLDDEIMSYIHL
tara:strand:- start:88 stop:294 length:207 start_codon:yes stop_codon:yes gene_type:complete